MSCMLRSLCRRLLYKSIVIASSAQRNHAVLTHSRSFASRWTFSRTAYENEERLPVTPQNERGEGPCISSAISKQLAKIEEDRRKRGIISLFCLNKILDLLNERKSLSRALAVKLTHCCGIMLAHETPCTRIELVQRMWNTFEKYGLQFTIDHYNALLRVYNENEFPFNPSEVMEEINAKGLAPNAETYQLIIFKYGLDGDIQNINKLLEVMREKNISILADVYRALVICHSKNNRMEDALNILEVVTKMEPAALPVVRSALTIQYVKRKDIKKALEILINPYFKACYSLNEYFNILYELAVNDYESEFQQVLNGYKHPPNYNTKVPIHIVRLIAANKTEYAYRILRTMHQLTRPTGVRIALAPFYISTLVAFDVPGSTIVKQCLDLSRNNDNELALQVAMHESLRKKKEALALSLFQAAKDNNLPVRLHYFWPLLLNRAKEYDVDGVFHLLDIMYNQYNLVANSETLRFYVIPFIYSKNMDTIAFMHRFKPYGVSLSTLIGAIVHHLLIQHEFQKAAAVAECYGATYPMHRYGKITADLFVETKDFQSFVKLTKAYYVGSTWHRTSSNSTEDPPENLEDILHDQRSRLDSMVYAAVEKLMRENNGAVYVIELFQCMLKNKITISPDTIDKMKKQLFSRELLDGDLSSLLEQMKLEKITTKLTYKSEIEDDPKRSKSMERFYEEMGFGDETSELGTKYLFNLYAKHYNLEKLLNLKQKLEAENYPMTSGMYSYVLDTLVEYNRWEDALELYQNRLQDDENFYLDYLKLFRFASLLVRNDRAEDAYRILSKHQPSQKENPRRIALATKAYSQLLKSLVQKNDLDQFKAFFKIFQTLKFRFTEGILEPLIEIHLARNDVRTALEEYMKYVEQCNLTPCKEKLMRALVTDGDRNNLREFLVATSSPHTEGQTLHDLIIVYLELDKIKEARRVLQSRILKLNPGGAERLIAACEKYYAANDTKNLLNLFLVTRDTRLFDREDLCSKILTTCIYTKDVEKAQILWTEMQDENLVPPPEFLNSLANLFRDNNLPVQFDYTEGSDGKLSVPEVSSSA